MILKNKTWLNEQKWCIEEAGKHALNLKEKCKLHKGNNTSNEQTSHNFQEKFVTKKGLYGQAKAFFTRKIWKFKKMDKKGES